MTDSSDFSDLKKRGLGRGLDALMDDGDAAPAGPDGAPDGVRLVPVEHLLAGTFQPRTQFFEADLEELAASIRAHGVLQPILVRPVDGMPDRYEVVAGERRWRAATIAQLHEIPAIVRPLDDAQALEIGLIENLQRVDLDPLDEAWGYERLMEEFGHSQDTLAKVMGRSRSYVANVLRLLTLPDVVQNLLRDKKITPSHARVLGGASNPAALAEHVVRGNLSVREVEQMVARSLRGREAEAAQEVTAERSARAAETEALAERLEGCTGLRVKVALREAGGGTVTFRMHSPGQLDALITALERGYGAA